MNTCCATAQNGSFLDNFSGLYSAEYPYLRRMLLGMVKDPSLAEDYAQEAFLRAWQALPRFRGGSSFRTWITRIAINLVISDRRRAEHRYGRVALDDPERPVDIPDRRAGGMRDPFLTAKLERAISVLTPRERQAFVLRHVDELGQDEAAAAMGCSRINVRGAALRARVKLRKKLLAVGH